MQPYLSNRGRSYVKEMPPLMEAHFRIADQLYHPVQRPDGYINMGTAENHLMDSAMASLISKIQCSMPVTSAQMHYDYSYGTRELRTAIADYWQKYVLTGKNAPKVTADNIIVTAGCSVALEFLATMLGDVGDVFLVPTPFYSGFLDDVSGRVGLEIVGVDAGPSLDPAAFEAALSQQRALGKKVVGVLYSSPNNPVGTLYTPEQIQGIIDFCSRNHLELISDELYAQTVHDPADKFVSAFELAPKEFLPHLHVTGSFSKDFALSGFRTGFLITFHEEMLQGMHVLSYYANVSNHTQAILAQLLRSEELPQLLKDGRALLKHNCTYMRNALADIGIKSAPSQSGFFLFSDFSPFMETKDKNGELVLWDKLFNELKINITPGFVFSSPRPGFFRICSAHPMEYISEACRRLSHLQPV